MVTTGATWGAAPVEGLSAELVDALRDGPFDVALDLAFRRRGLSMEAVQRRVAGRGERVSQATLSYWRRGQRRPEGERSLRVVHVVEECLGLPADSLTRLITPRVVEGAVPATQGLATLLDLDVSALESCDGIDLRGNSRMTIMSLHARVRIGRERTEQSVRFDFVVVAKTDGVDRWVVFFHPLDVGGHSPVIVDTDACRPGRTRSHQETELIAVELRFDHPLRAGETHVFGVEIGYSGPPPRNDCHQYGIRTPAKLLMMQVAFEPDTVPVRCYRFFKPRNPPGPVRESELIITPSTTSHIAVADAQPGVHGIRWEWD